MNVLVCFKAVPELETMAESDWRPDENFHVETRFTRTVWNPQDESALELALKFRDQAGPPGRSAPGLTALTIGGPRAEPLLKTLLALKFDRAVLLEAPDAPLFHPEWTAAVIADFARAEGCALVVMGGRSADGDNAAVPLLAAERLGRPALTQVTDFHWRNDGLLQVESLADDGRRSQTVRPPLVLAVGNAPTAHLRVPTLRDKMGPGQRPVEKFTVAGPAEEDPAPPLVLAALTRRTPCRAAVIVEGDSPEAKARLLYQNHLRGRL